jgi:hypothetical protein
MTTRTIQQCLETVRAAMDQNPAHPQRMIANELMKLGDLLIRKNSDYGCSAWQEPLMAPGVNPRTAILVRMSDKVARVHALMQQNGTGLVEESLEDTIRDLQGYCLLWLACPDECLKEL